MAKRRAAGSGGVEINMTPMIDVTFQLIIFFILTAQMTSENLAKLIVPDPHKTVAWSDEQIQDIPNKAIINVVNQYGQKAEGRDPMAAGEALYYKLGVGDPIPVGDIKSLEAVLEARRRQAEQAGFKDFFVEIRADKDIFYENILPAMHAASAAGISKMSITAKEDPNTRPEWATQ
jgi:biopolymer transport protein ExbD